jgi:hypothetical protein
VQGEGCQESQTLEVDIVLHPWAEENLFLIRVPSPPGA